METEKQMIYVEELVLAIRDDLEINSSNFARVMDHIREAKTVDAMKVVRCRECKKKRCEHGYLWCFKWDEQVQEDDFCSYGERRSDV